MARLSTAIDKQVVKKAMASLVYLRDGEDMLRKNVADRNITIDVEKLVRSGRFYLVWQSAAQRLCSGMLY